MAKPTVEGTTRVVGIIGDPVDHSLSPRMHNAAFASLGLDYIYVPFRTSARKLGDAVRSVGRLGLAGLNITVPFKQAATGHVDRLSPTARAVGAVNTVYADGRRLVGENTDVAGFMSALGAAGLRLRGKSVLVIGAGGAARAVVYALAEGGAADVVIANRTLAKAKRLAREFSRRSTPIQAAGLGVLEDVGLLENRRLVVNCTSLGLKGKTPDYNIEATRDDCIHFDLAYGGKPTPFMKSALANKRPVIDGRLMLLHQGAAAFKFFTGRKAPVAVMAKALGLNIGKTLTT